MDAELLRRDEWIRGETNPYEDAFDALDDANATSLSDAIAHLSAHCAIGAVAKTIRDWRADMVTSPPSLADTRRADQSLAIKAYLLPVDGERSVAQIIQAAITNDELKACIPYLRFLCVALERLDLPTHDGVVWVAIHPDEEFTFLVEGSSARDHLWVAPKRASVDQVHA